MIKPNLIVSSPSSKTMFQWNKWWLECASHTKSCILCFLETWEKKYHFIFPSRSSIWNHEKSGTIMIHQSTWCLLALIHKIHFFVSFLLTLPCLLFYLFGSILQPYLHESRHQHAMRRARGCGGRFLNTKKLDESNANPTSAKGSVFGVTLSAQSASSSGSEQQEEKGRMIQDMLDEHTYSNGNRNGHGLSSEYHASNSNDGGDCFGQPRENMQMNTVSHRALPIK